MSGDDDFRAFSSQIDQCAELRFRFRNRNGFAHNMTLKKVLLLLHPEAHQGLQRALVRMPKPNVSDHFHRHPHGYRNR